MNEQAWGGRVSTTMGLGSTEVSEDVMGVCVSVCVQIFTNFTEHANPSKRCIDSNKLIDYD